MLSSRVWRAAQFAFICISVTIGLAVTARAQDKAQTDYSCNKSALPHDAIVSGLRGEEFEVGLYDEHTRSQVGKFTFTGALWFFDGGHTTIVQEGTRVLDFSFGNYHPGGTANLKLCASDKYFILPSENRRFRLEFPSNGPAAFITEIKLMPSKPSVPSGLTATPGK
jgi:hypothetical protein